jgi:hypothetical protein
MYTALLRLPAGLLLAWGLSCPGAPDCEREIPPAYGPHVQLGKKDFAEARSFKPGDRIVGTYYFYWYNQATREHIVNAEDGSDGLTDHPPTLEDFSYTSVRWHKQQLLDMEAAGLDLLLAVFWGAPSERSPKAALHWSYAGLGPLVQAREQLLKEGRRPPRIGLFYDTSTLRYNDWGVHIDLTTDYGKRWFYATIRDFFSAIPPKHWAMINDRPIVLLYAAAFAKNHDQSFVEFTKDRFKSEFGGRELYLAPQDSWRAKGDNVCSWGGAFGLRNPGIAELGPGYDDTRVYGRKPLIRKREGGKFYEENWLKFLRRPSSFVMIETWNEFHEGTEICESREYGRQYIELTRRYGDRFKQGWRPAWPKGPLTGASEISVHADGEGTGLSLVAAEDGKVTLEPGGNRPAWYSRPEAAHSGYIYFRVDDSFKWAAFMRASLEVEYLDLARGTLRVEFDGSDPTAPLDGAYTPSRKTALVGDGDWKRAVFELEGARFLNSQNGGADFRLVAEAPGVAVRRLTLKRR